MASSRGFLQKMMPDRGPRNDLWVVEVTTSQCSNGLLHCFVANKKPSSSSYEEEEEGRKMLHQMVLHYTEAAVYQGQLTY